MPPDLRMFQAADFRGRIPTESLSFSSEKSYSPSMLIGVHDIGEWAAIMRRRLSLVSKSAAFSIWQAR